MISVGMFDGYSLEEAINKFNKYLDSDEFKKLSKDYFTKLLNENNRKGIINDKND